MQENKCSILLPAIFVSMLGSFHAHGQEADKKKDHNEFFASEADYYIDLGYFLESQSSNQPLSYQGELERESLSEHIPYGVLDFGVPFQYLGSHGRFGYRYRNLFRSTGERVAQFGQKPSMEDFPLHPRFSLREHRLNLDLHLEGSLVGAGIEGYYQVARFGSNSMPGPKESRQKSVASSETFLWKPYLALRYGEARPLETRLTLYLKKEVSHESENLSYKTYDQSKISMALAQKITFPDMGSHFQARAFRFRNYFVDLQNDFIRSGFLVMGEKEVGDLRFLALYSTYTDAYEQPLISTTGCGPSLGSADLCDRKELGFFYRVGLRYLWDEESMISAVYDYQENKNDNFHEYDFSRSRVFVSYTIFHNSLERVPFGPDHVDNFGFGSKLDRSF